MENDSVSVVDNGNLSEKRVFDLDQALEVVGLGWYNAKYCLVLALFLIASIMEVLGYSYLLPSARCDLSISDSQRGIIASLPYIGIVVTSFFWGYVVDTLGRKKALIYSSLGSGIFGMVAAFMPELISFTAFKFLGALCLACPAAVPYTLIGEILPQKHRDIALSITNALQTLGSALVPLLAWGILPQNFRIDFGSYEFRSWRLLTLVYSFSFILCVIFMLTGPESPKYLVAQRRHDDALKVLQTMYAGNKGGEKSFPITYLKMPPESDRKVNFLKSIQQQSIPLLKPPYLKWMCINGVLLFGIFSVLNGLFMWVPDVLNRVLTGESEGLTACQIIARRFDNVTLEDDGVCDDTISEITFIISSIANCSCAAVTLMIGASLKIIGKKNLLIFIYLLFGSFSISINYIKQDIVFSVLLSSLQVIAVGVGPINAYAIDIFPTQLRGMAVALGLMIGRFGSVVATNVAGILILSNCEANFYLFGGLLLFCGLLSLLLPQTNSVFSKSRTIDSMVTKL